MTTLTEKFTALEDQLAAQSAVTNALVDTIEPKLQALLDLFDIMLVNNAANTKALIAALGQNNPCMPCPTPPLLIPPIGTTPLPVNTEACQRSQAFLNFMLQVFTVLDLTSSVGVGFNPSLITDAFNQVIDSLSAPDQPDPISFPEAVQLVGDLVSYVATNLFEGNTLVDTFTTLYAELRNALASAGSADVAKTQYDAIVSASEIGSWIKPVLISAAYGALYTYFFDPASTPDLTGIDGSVCGIAGCETMSSGLVSVNGGASQDIIIWEAPFNGSTSNGAGSTADQPVWCDDDLGGFIITATATCRYFSGTTNLGDVAADTPFEIPAELGAKVAIVRIGSTGAYSAEVCPPE